MVRHFQKNNRDPSLRPSEEFYDTKYGCYAEEYFHEMLTFERKRSERSGRPFVVMTLDVTGARKPGERMEIVKTAVKALNLLTRLTDIKGWYRSSMVLGVLFTEMNSLETETLVNKINENLRCMLSEEQLAQIRIAFHRFPDDGRDTPDDGDAFTFYPEKAKPKGPPLE